MSHPLFIKALVITLLTVLLMIPLILIDGIVQERSDYRDQARRSIAQSWTGTQMLLGPVLAVPFKESHSSNQWNEARQRFELKTQSKDRILLIAPSVLKVDGVITTETRKRGIYAVPVYQSQLNVSGLFEFSKIKEFAGASSHQLEWRAAYLSVMVSDVRGVEIQPLLKWQGETREFAPDTLLSGMPSGMHVPLGNVHTQEGAAEFSFDLKLNGMELLQFSPIGKNTSISLKADWPDPSFSGRYLPSSHDINDQGFKATWNLSSFASNIPQHLSTCQEGNCAMLLQESFGVRLYNSVDIYQKSERSVKYALMFIGLTFVTFYLYEVMKGLRLHPMQYLLVGLGLSVFYLLLISLSEHMAFRYAYALATLASTLLIGFYISSVLRSVTHGGMITSALLLLYGMLYGILSSEDNSLLMGSLLIFGVLSLVMIVTRRIDWYALTDDLSSRIATKQTHKRST